MRTHIAFFSSLAAAPETPEARGAWTIDGEGNFGYNAATVEYGDLIAMGILDPTKVARSALQNASFIAGLMITSEAMVAEEPREENLSHGAGMGGGMGDMDY